MFGILAEIGPTEQKYLVCAVDAHFLKATQNQEQEQHNNTTITTALPSSFYYNIGLQWSRNALLCAAS